MPRFFLPLPALFLAAALALSGCAGASYRLPEVGAQDLRAARDDMAARPETLRIYERSNLWYARKLNQVNYRLASHAGALCSQAGYPNCNFQVVYSKGDTINAYASDGYKITVFRGLLQYMKNEEEIAAVVAHEMGHHLAHHNKEAAQNATTGALAAGVLGAVLVGLAGADSPGYSALEQQRDVENFAALGAQIGAQSYTKDQEREADLLGAYLLARAGYDLGRAKEMLFTLARLPGSGDQTRPSARNTHPSGVERLAAWDKAVTEIRANPGKLPYPSAAR